jgi:Fe-Mn family superoxide dismutase
MTDEIKPLPFDPKAINGLSEKNLVSHYENNYIRVVKRLNTIGAKPTELDYAETHVFTINGLKREELIATNSMICMRPISRVLAVMASHAECWPARSRVTSAVSTDGGPYSPPSARPRGGVSGRVILGYLPTDKRLVNRAADHMTTLASGRPVLVLDMYEHAYHMDFDAKPPPMSAPMWKRSAGTMRRSCTSSIAARPDFRSSAGTTEISPRPCVAPAPAQ